MKRVLPMLVLALAVLAVAAWLWKPRNTEAVAIERTNALAVGESGATPVALEANFVEVAETTRAVLPSEPRAVAPSDASSLVAATQEAFLKHNLLTGAISGVVVRRTPSEDTPIEGAEIELLEEQNPVSAGPTPIAAASFARTSSDRDGAFSFSNGPAGRWRLRARLRTGETTDCSSGRRADFGSWRVRIVFGSAAIEGVVHQTNGEVQPGIVVRLARSSRGEEEGAEAWQVTDGRGHYLFSGLAAGAYELSISAPAQQAVPDALGNWVWNQGWPSRVIAIQLAEADRLVLDAGSVQGARTWRGRIRTPGGDDYAPGRDVVLACDLRTLRGSTATTTITRKTQDKKGIECSVEPGVWRVSVVFAPKDIWEMPRPIAVSGTDIDFDLVVPGARIVGRAFDAETGMAPSLAQGRQRVHFKLFGKSSSEDPDREAELGADGSFTVLLRGGTDWVLRTDPLPLSMGRRSLDLTLDLSQALQQLEVELGRP